jgi:hypothetical protein
VFEIGAQVKLEVNLNNKSAAVEEQQKKYTKFATGFAKRLTHHLNNLFIHQVSNFT